MDPVELNKMVEKAKADASATGASKKAPPKDSPAVKSERSADSLLEIPDEEVDRLAQEVVNFGQEEDREQGNKKQAELERGRHVKIAKLLAAMDVFAGAAR